MPDVIEQLRSYGEAVQRSASRNETLAPLELESSPRRRNLVRTAVLVVLVAAVVMAAILVVDRDRPQVASTSREPAWRSLYDTSDQGPVVTPLFLVPAKLPDGYRLGRAYGGPNHGGGSGGGSPGIGGQQVWSRFDAVETRPVETVWVQWGPTG